MAVRSSSCFVGIERHHRLTHLYRYLWQKLGKYVHETRPSHFLSVISPHRGTTPTVFHQVDSILSSSLCVRTYCVRGPASRPP